MKVINKIKLSDSLLLAECPDGFMLYDSTRGMNLAMRETSERSALLAAIKYYQSKLEYTEKSLNSLKGKVLGFVELFVEEVAYGSNSDIPEKVLQIKI